jgi:hypothetical protein
VEGWRFDGRCSLFALCSSATRHWQLTAGAVHHQPRVSAICLVSYRIVRYSDTVENTINYVDYQSNTSLAVYKVPYNEYLVEISGSLACSRDYLYWFRLAVLGNI